jgi:hypothetical protein
MLPLRGKSRDLSLQWLPVCGYARVPGDGAAHQRVPLIYDEFLQLGREKSQLPSFRGIGQNSRDISNAYSAIGVESSNPICPASQSGLCGVISGCVKTADIPAA